MNIQYVSAVIFMFLMLIFLVIKRKKIDIQKILLFPLLYFAMYRTKIGLKFMDKFAKKLSKPLKHIGYFAIFIGFFGMLMITYALVKNAYNLLTNPMAAPGAALVLPFEVKGAFYVPFFYWISAIFIIALVHEFSHGIFARKYGMKIKSSGFAFLGILLPIIPAAFVEPDEKELRKRPAKEQLSVFAAGPFANILLAFVVLGIMALITPILATSMIDQEGVLITGVMEGYPAKKAGITGGEIINKIDDIEIVNTITFSDILTAKKPGDQVSIDTDKSTYSLTLAENPEDNEKAYLGIYVQQNTNINSNFTDKYGIITAKIILWLVGLLYWLYVLNLGIGLFNLAPMGPLDGGRMLLVGLQQFMKEEKAVKLWKNIGIFFLVLVLVNIMFAFIR